MSVRIATVPILWNNDDLGDLAPRVPFELVLDEIAAAGFDGTELGSDYPRDPDRLKAALEARHLALCAAYFCLPMTDEATAPGALEEGERLIAFLSQVGAQVLVVAQPLVPERLAVAGRARKGPELGANGWKVLLRSLEALGDRARALGLQVAYHNHAGTYVETPMEVERLMDGTDPERVGLCLDTGHYLYGGGDPVPAVARYLPRLRHLHLKDVDRGVLEGVVGERRDFLEALRRRVFVPLGKGSLDVGSIAAILKREDWSGWIVSEQDTTFEPPLQAARASRAALGWHFPAVPARF